MQASVEVTYDEFLEVKDTISRHVTDSLEVTPGSTITVTLWSNQTTGFKWSEDATITDQSIIQQIEHKYIPPEDEELVGASGKEVWTFKAPKEGTTTVSMEYSQPWEGGEKDAYGFFLTVVVK
jgi:inhibitor of cysteine peptidase